MKKLLFFLSIFAIIPAQSSAMAQKIVTYLSSSEEYTKCPICLENLVNGNEFIRVKCDPDSEIFHTFHITCFNNGIDNRMRNCPVCRRDSLKLENYSTATFEKNSQALYFCCADLFRGFLKGAGVAMRLHGFTISTQEPKYLLGKILALSTPIFPAAISFCSQQNLCPIYSTSLAASTNRQTLDSIVTSCLFNTLMCSLEKEKALVSLGHKFQSVGISSATYAVDNMYPKAINILTKPSYDYTGCATQKSGNFLYYIPSLYGGLTSYFLGMKAIEAFKN